MSNFGVWTKGALPPTTPINPYLGGNARKKWATFYLSVHLCTLCKPHFGAKYGPRGPPRAIYEPGGPGCHRDTYCIERVKVRLGWEHLKWKNVKNGVETMSFGRKMSIIKFHPVLANMLLTLWKNVKNDTKNEYPMAKIAVKSSEHNEGGEVHVQLR